MSGFPWEMRRYTAIEVEKDKLAVIWGKFRLPLRRFLAQRLQIFLFDGSGVVFFGLAAGVYGWLMGEFSRAAVRCSGSGSYA